MRVLGWPRRAGAEHRRERHRAVHLACGHRRRPRAVDHAWSPCR